MERIFVYGAGGQGRVVVDTMGNAQVAFGLSNMVDDDRRLQGREILGHVVRGNDAIDRERGFIAIGDNDARIRIASRFRGRLVTLIHRTAFVGRNVGLGEGTVLMAGTVVNVGSRIGDNVIINTGATIDHDCEVDNGAQIAPGCHLCGNVQVGEGTLLGVGTVVVPGIRIGRRAFIHAGQVVTRDVPDGAIVSTPR